MLGERLLAGGGPDDGLTSFDALCMTIARLEANAQVNDRIISDARFRHAQDDSGTLGPICTDHLDAVRSMLAGERAEDPVDELAEMEALLNGSASTPQRTLSIVPPSEPDELDELESQMQGPPEIVGPPE